MSALEETIRDQPVTLSAARPVHTSAPTQFLKLLCSVRFGVTMLILLGTACLIGMLIMQQNVDGFQRYFAELTPAQRLVYGRFGFFDIHCLLNAGKAERSIILRCHGKIARGLPQAAYRTP